MKKIFFTILACSLLFSSCNDWLDLDPALEIRQDAIFETEQGFKDVLTGVYIRMGTPQLYGRNTSMILPELLAQDWTFSRNDMATAVSGFDFTQTDARSLLETVWLQYYQCIVNLNSILAVIDDKKDLFASGNYELIKGEALGLRAFLHFEVLKLWGAVPEKIAMGDKAIPYVTVETKDPNQLIVSTYKEVLDSILAELDEAERLLAGDPILSFSYEKLNKPSSENTSAIGNEFYYYRYIKFNIMAVKATKARYYMWLGETSKAAGYAREVINATDKETGEPVFTLGAEDNKRNKDYPSFLLTFPTEQIFAASNSLATQTLAPVFFQWHTGYTQAMAKLREAFETTLHTSDIRWRDNRLWEVRGSSEEFNYFKKYNITESTAIDDIPLIRLAEMYFIVIESGDTSLFRDYRVARGLDGSIDGSLTSHEAIMERLEKEYRKDFYGEGQMFFFYKRLNYDHIAWPAAKDLTPEDYKLPIPETQTLFE